MIAVTLAWGARYRAHVAAWSESIRSGGMRSLTVALLCLMVIGCASRRHRPDSPFMVSPQGYRVAYQDQGTILSGKASIEVIWSWHAAAVQRALGEIATKRPADRAVAEAKSRTVAYRLVDNCAFPASVGPQWATGEWVPYANTAFIALYARREGTQDQIPKDAPSWTVRQNPTNPLQWRWGVYEAGKEFPALAHEIGNAVFGYGWDR